MSTAGGLQRVVFKGKDCQIVFQNSSSRLFHRKCLVGERSIYIRSGDWSVEAIRDRVWRGETVSFFETPLFVRERDVVLNWSYAPVYDKRNRVTGFIGQGFTRLAAMTPTLVDLATWLESVASSDAPASEQSPLGTCSDSQSDSRRRLAELFRRSLQPLQA